VGEEQNAGPQERRRHVLDAVLLGCVALLFLLTVFVYQPGWGLVGRTAGLGAAGKAAAAALALAAVAGPVVLVTAFGLRLRATAPPERGFYVETALNAAAVWLLFTLTVYYRQTWWGQAALLAVLLMAAVIFVRRLSRTHKAFKDRD